MKTITEIVREQVPAGNKISDAPFQSLIRQSWRKVGRDMYRDDEWFRRQCDHTHAAWNYRNALSVIDGLGPTGLQEILFAISMLFIDSGKSDEELAEIMKQRTP